MSIEKLKFLTNEQVLSIAQEFGTPVYVYDQKTLVENARKVLSFPNAYGLTARFAMKSSPSLAILKIFAKEGLHIDASSEYEVYRALKAGIPGHHIQLTAQEYPEDFSRIISENVFFNACSLEQVRRYGQANKGGELSLRVNPGLGSGSTNRTNVGGPASSFGIWHEALEEAIKIAGQYNLKITKIHTHIGSGSDPEVWKKVALMSLATVEKIPTVHTLNLGGGYKVGRMSTEYSTDLQACGEPVKQAFVDFAQKTGRKLKLEVEPGTFLVANAGCILTKVIDKLNTGSSGYEFLKVNCGMTEVTRPSLYGAQHPIVIVPKGRQEKATAEYIVAGHCCESGDILTPAPGDPEALKARAMTRAEVGDIMVIEGSGAYCAGMSTKNYNSFPEAAEILFDTKGKSTVVRKRQTLEQMLQNEIAPNGI